MDQQHAALGPAYRSRETHRVAAQRIGRCAAARGPLGMRHHRFDVIELPAQRSSASPRAPRWACSRRSAPAIRCSADSGPTPGAGRRQRPWCSPVCDHRRARPHRALARLRRHAGIAGALLESATRALFDAWEPDRAAPAHAGMNRSRGRGRSCWPGVPRARGDEPTAPQRCTSQHACSPPVRGWTPPG